MKLHGHPADLLIDAHIILSRENVAKNIEETEFAHMQNRNRVRSAAERIRLVKEKKES